MFRVVDGKGCGLGDDLFRNHSSFVSILEVQYAPSFQLSLKRILSISEASHHMWEVWKLALCIQRYCVWDGSCHSLVRVTIWYYIYHLIFQIISYSYFSLSVHSNKLSSQCMSHQIPICSNHSGLTVSFQVYVNSFSSFNAFSQFSTRKKKIIYFEVQSIITPWNLLQSLFMRVSVYIIMTWHADILEFIVYISVCLPTQGSRHCFLFSWWRRLLESL